MVGQEHEPLSLCREYRGTCPKLVGVLFPVHWFSYFKATNPECGGIGVGAVAHQVTGVAITMCKLPWYQS